MVEVFKTKIRDTVVADLAIQKLREYLPSAKITFDLEDCDKILRVEAEHVLSSQIVQLIHNLGYYCEALD